MIVWGGFTGSGYTSTGGMYDPVSLEWVETTIENNSYPQARGQHTAIWTGSEMLIWGGIGNGGTITTDGGRFYPETTFYFYQKD